ncbi:MAG: deoxyribonuclease IV [Gemmatimonadaceae bacterium]
MTPLLGAHVSTAGGIATAPPRARAIAATAMQVFTKQANRWAERSCDEPEIQAFRAALADTAVRVTVSHDSYLINLASPDPTLRQRSMQSFIAELQRCEALGLDFLVSHPGNYMDNRSSGIERNADAITACLEQVPGRTVLCMETTAGAGTVLGATFEELAGILGRIPAALQHRLGVCLDTCHVFAAGYDLITDYAGVWTRFADTVGRERLRVIHLNDSKTPFGSRRDRHELIGEGALGEEPFRQLMNDERLEGVAMVIETPKGDDHTATDTRMLDRLRGYRLAADAT